jgi:hypothetical protein
MKGQLEDFVRQNREAFDDKEPSASAWRKIEGALRFKKSSPWNSVIIWRAAAIIFMVLSGYLLIPKGSAIKQSEFSMKEFTDVEQFYFQEISEKTELIQEFQRNEGMNGFTQDFQQLEAMYLVLKEEMKNRPSQKVKDALVLNLLVRIDLLNQQLHKLEKEYKPAEEEEKEPSENA